MITISCFWKGISRRSMKLVLGSKYGLKLKSGGVLNSPLAKPSVLWALMTWFPKTLTYDMLPVKLTFSSNSDFLLDETFDA